MWLTEKEKAKYINKKDVYIPTYDFYKLWVEYDDNLLLLSFLKVHSSDKNIYVIHIYQTENETDWYELEEVIKSFLEKHSIKIKSEIKHSLEPYEELWSRDLIEYKIHLSNNQFNDILKSQVELLKQEIKYPITKLSHTSLRLKLISIYDKEYLLQKPENGRIIIDTFDSLSYQECKLILLILAFEKRVIIHRLWSKVFEIEWLRSFCDITLWKDFIYEIDSYKFIYNWVDHKLEIANHKLIMDSLIKGLWKELHYLSLADNFNIPNSFIGNEKEFIRLKIKNLVDSLNTKFGSIPKFIINSPEWFMIKNPLE